MTEVLNPGPTGYINTKTLQHLMFGIPRVLRTRARMLDPYVLTSTSPFVPFFIGGRSESRGPGPVGWPHSKDTTKWEFPKTRGQ